MTIQTQNLIEAIQLLSGSEKPTSTPTPSAVPPPPMPAEVQQTLQKAKEKAVGISLLVSVSYTSLSGNVKNRDVLIRRIIRSKDDLFIDGLAMDIQAPRLIKASHVTQIRDQISGRVYTDVYDFIQNRLGVSLQPETPSDENKPTDKAVSPPPAADDFPKAIERIGTELTVLMYLVAIDGVRDKSERQQVLNYALSCTTDLTYRREDMEDYIISLAPDEESFSMALTKSLSKDQDTVQRLVEAMLNIIMADGKVDPKERAFLIRIMDLLEHNGYEIKLPI